MDQLIPVGRYCKHRTIRWVMNNDPIEIFEIMAKHDRGQRIISNPAVLKAFDVVMTRYYYDNYTKQLSKIEDE